MLSDCEIETAERVTNDDSARFCRLQVDIEVQILHFKRNITVLELFKFQLRDWRFKRSI